MNAVGSTRQFDCHRFLASANIIIPTMVGELFHEDSVEH